MDWDPCSSHSIFPAGIWVENKEFWAWKKPIPGISGWLQRYFFWEHPCLESCPFPGFFFPSLGLKTCLGWAGLDLTFPPWNLMGKPGFGVVPAAPSRAGIPELLDFIPDPNPGWKSRKRVRIRPGILSLESLWGPGSASGMIRE